MYFFELHLIVHLVSDHGSVSDCWEEGKLAVCSRLLCCGGLLGLGFLCNSQVTLDYRVHISDHVYAVFANCMKSHSELFP